MSITDRRSVLILGAGVSAPFGLPLGDTLVDAIADTIGKEAGRASHSAKVIDPNVVVEWSANPKYWYANPIYGTLLRYKRENRNSLSAEEANDAHRDLQKLRTLLTNQTAETIDAFIAENPHISMVAKLALAALILRACYSIDQHGFLSLKPFSHRTTHPFTANGNPAERNWIHLLINIIRHGIDLGEIEQGRRLQIVTFNYDTILEHVLEHQFANRESPLGHYSNYIEIRHVHGQFGPLDDKCSDPADTAIQWAKGIFAVKEQCSARLDAERTRAKQFISAARKVYAMGFAFAGPNCRVLGLNDPPITGGRRLVYCNYDGNRGTKESAERYFSGSGINEKSGTWQRPMSAASFIKSGYLGEPPS